MYKLYVWVEIVIEDVNENYFVLIFFCLIVVVLILENLEKNIVVLVFLVFDVDDGSNGEIVYSVVGGLGLGKFNIDENIG